MKSACGLLVFWTLFALRVGAAEPSGKPAYEKVDAIFRELCLDCHGATDPEGKLVLEDFESLKLGGESGTVVVPGKPDESLLVRMIEGGMEKDGKKRIMPPGKRRKLTPEEVATVREWVAAGAPAPTGPRLAVSPVVPKIKPVAAPKRPILALATIPGGDMIAAAKEADVELVSFDIRQTVKVLKGERGIVNVVKFSPDGRLLYAAGGEAGVFGQVVVWEVSTGKKVHSIVGHKDAIYALAVSPDGKRLATGSYDQKIKLWKSDSGEEVRTLSGHNGAIFDLSFRPDGKLLASASADRTVKLWDVATGERRDTLSQSLKEVYAVAFSKDGKRLVSGGVDNRIRLYEVSEQAAETTNPLLEARFAHEGAILRLVYSPDGQTIASSADDRTVKLWGAAELKERLQIEKQPDWPPALGFPKDDKALVVGRLDGTLQFYEAQSGAILPMPKPEISAIEPRGVQRGLEARFRLTGKHLASLGSVKLHHDKLKGELLSEPAPTATEAWFRVAVPADLPRAGYEVSVISTNGESGRLKFYVDDLPQLVVKDHAPKVQQLASLPVSVWGIHEKLGQGEDFEFEAKAGQELVFDVSARSIGSKSDLTLTLTDSTGKVLDEANGFDDNPDPLLTHRFAVEGRYRLLVRESPLGASAEHFYRLSTGELPFVTGFSPLGARTNSETEVRLIGHNLGTNQVVRLRAALAGETDLPINADRLRSRRTFKASVGPEPQLAEVEPNNQLSEAHVFTAPASIAGFIEPAGDVDLYRFEAKAGQAWMIETTAAQLGSPVDTKIEVLWPDGKPVERLRLQAVRNSAITFRGIDSNSADCRVDNWEEMELNQFLYLQGEVVRLFRAPQGPDSGFVFYTLNGKRRDYFDTSATAHPNEEPCYIVEPAPAGAKPRANGLPAFPVYFNNDDDASRRNGSDSKLTFTAPVDGAYLVRVTDSRGCGGPRFAYRLLVRQPVPDFTVTLQEKTPTIDAGSGRAFTVSAERKDGFEGEIRVEIDGLPAGFAASGPLEIQAGHTSARGTLNCLTNAVSPSESACSNVVLTASAMIAGVKVVHPVANFGKMQVGAAPKVFVALEPEAKAMAQTVAAGGGTVPVLEIAPGQTIPAVLKVRRAGHEDLLTFTVENLPHGVIVDNIGLNGVLIPKDQSERTIYLTAAKWVPETERLCFAVENQAGGQTSRPVLLRVRKDNSAGRSAALP